MNDKEANSGLRQAECRPARSSDAVAVHALLVACGLPTDGLGEQFGERYVIVNRNRWLIGIAGVEIYESDGLLRSVAVERSCRGEGIGKMLVEERVAWAKEQGIRALYLLTIDGEGFFARLGFESIVRDEVPELIRHSKEFVDACPSTAIAMRRLLT